MQGTEEQALKCAPIVLSICRDLGTELKNSLTCVLDGSTTSSKALGRCIDALVSGINKRLDLTQETIDIMAQLELVNEKLNYV